MEPLISIQPRSGGGLRIKPDDIVLERAGYISNKFSTIDNFKIERGAVHSIYNNDGKKKSPLGNFLCQECDKFNNLISLIKTSVNNLELAVRGLIVMSPDIEKIYHSFLNNQVPKLWEENAYLSIKPLSFWINDLAERILFMGNWLYEGAPVSFWISAFFFPQGISMC
jgi:dynein heavy chain